MYVQVTQLSEEKAEFWHNILPIGSFYTMQYGKVEITKELVDTIAENFKKGRPHFNPPVNIAHDNKLGKYGEIVELEAREDGLWALIRLTEEGKKLLEEEKFSYVSAEFADDFIDKQTGEPTGPVLVGLALTNTPAHPKVEPIHIDLSEKIRKIVFDVFKKFGFDFENTKKFALLPNKDIPVDEESDWSFDWVEDANEIIDKLGWNGLKQACLWYNTEYENGESGVPEVKKAYKLPIAKIKDEKLTVYRKGVIAAMQALLGARGGVDIPTKDKKEVYDILSKWYEYFGMEPPEFHLEESGGEEMDKKILEEKELEIKKLSEEKEELTTKLSEMEDTIKKLSEEKAAVEKELITYKVELWANKWLHEGIIPATIEKAKEIVLSEPARMKEFDELFETMKKPELLKTTAKEEKTISDAERAKNVVKALFENE